MPGVKTRNTQVTAAFSVTLKDALCFLQVAIPTFRTFRGLCVATPDLSSGDWKDPVQTGRHRVIS